jgi:hypothetical protein
MPFVLREEGSTENPPLATVYGKQITAGKLAYYIKEGRTKCIIILGEGEMDGIDQVYYNGTVLPEFASGNQSDRNWKFHPGTITTQATNYYDVTAISGTTLTLASNPFTSAGAIVETLTATGGTRRLSYLGVSTTALAHNANAATIQTAINALSTVTAGAITVSGTFPNFTYTFSEAASAWSSQFLVDTGLLTGGTSTLSRPSEVALVAGVDPETSPYPTGVKQHQKLYVVYSSGNDIRLAFTPGGTPISWTSSAYLLTNLKIYSANVGFFDPVQGRPQFFPNINFTLSGIAYIEVNLPAEMSEIEDEPTKFKIYVRGRRLQNYTSTGLLADAAGVAYDPLNLPQQTKFFSANNALVALDIILNYMKVEKSRIDWETFVAFRDHCDETINWDSGTTEIFATPTFTLSNADSPIVGTVRRTLAGLNWADSGGLTTETTTSLESIQISGVWRGGHSAIGLTRATTISAPFHHNHAGNLFSIHPSTIDGRLRVYEGSVGTPIYNEANPFTFGDTFKIEVNENTVFFYKNDTVFHTASAAFGPGTTRGYVAFYDYGASYSDIKFFPMAGGTRMTNRFDAHNVFPQETDSATALQQIFGRAPDTHWQDVNGKIKFIVGSEFVDVTWGETPNASLGQRVLSDVFSYDPLGSNYLVPLDSKTEFSNYALTGIASVSSTQAGSFPTVSINNGNVATNGGWATTEGWAGNITTLSTSTPEWAIIDWEEKRPINEIVVYTLADAINYSSVTPADTFTTYGLQDFLIQYWNGLAWVTLEEVVGNNHVMYTSNFPVVMTDKIRIYMTKAADSRARLIEVQANGPTVIATVVPRSNIVADSFSSYKTPPENKPNFLRLELRDLDDPYYTKKYVYNSRDTLIDQLGHTVDFGVVPLGVATQSLADRLGEATMRWSTDLDLFINLKTYGSSYHVAKGDIVKVAHDVTGWGLNNPGYFIVIEETLEPATETADEKSYLLQSYNPEYYSDTAHGAITPNYPVQVSPLTPPPAVDSLTLTEESRIQPNGTAYTAIVGRVRFNTDYPYTQRARVYWKRALDTEYIATNIILEQPNTSVIEIPFELAFAQVGMNYIKVVTETLTGVVSSSEVVESIDISGTIQVEEIDWESLVNVTSLSGSIIKAIGTNAWDAGANSTKAIAYGEGYLQFTSDTNSTGFLLGFANYGKTDLTPAGFKYAWLYSLGNPPQIWIDNVGVSLDVTPVTCAAGQSYKIEVSNTEIKFYQVVGDVSTLIKTVSNQQVYPLYVKVSIYFANSAAPPAQIYGNLEANTGTKAHWASVRSVNITSVSGIETITKTGNTGWGGLESAGTFSNERIPKNGSVEFVATEDTLYRMLGLSEVDAEIATPNIDGHLGIKYAWYLEAGGVLSVRYFGTAYYSTTYVTGDILRIERIGTSIYFQKNGVLHYTFNTAPFLSSQPLYVDTAFYSNSSTLKDPRIRRVGNFTQIPYPYPIYLVQDLYISTSRPQDDGNVYFELAGVFDTTGEAPILRANVRLFDKFGTLKETFPPFTYAGNGLLAWGYHDRKYADPLEEGIYEVKLDNGIGLSAPLYTKAGTESFAMPTLLNPAAAVQDLTCAPVDHNRISINWTYSGNIDIWMRIEGTTAWGSPIATNVSTKPRILTGLVPNTYYEFRAAPTGTTANYSNICRTKTLQAPLPTETAPPPLNLVASLNGANPSTQVDLTWNRNSTTNTGVKVFKDGVQYGATLGATVESITVTGLSATTAYTFKVVNVYAGGDSIDSNIVTITTGTGASPNAPSGLSATGTSTSQIRLQWTNNTASGNVNIYRSLNGSSFSLLTTVPATQSIYNNSGLFPETTYWYKVENTTVTGFSNTAVGTTWDWSDNPCVTPDTLIWIVKDNFLQEIEAKYVREGDIILTVRKNGELAFTRVKKVKNGKSDTIYIFTTKSGRCLECTPSHPIVTNKKGDYTKAVLLGQGDQVLSYSPEMDKTFEERLESKETLRGDFNVIIYELEGEDHTFVSGNIVSHNRKNDE